LDENILKKYVGDYDMGNKNIIIPSKKGNNLFKPGPGLPDINFYLHLKLNILQRK
jgi:hypothetical protein